MIKFAVEKWEKHKNELRKDILDDYEFYNNTSYTALVEKVFEIIFQPDDYSELEIDTDRITVIDNGDYQGTMLFMIPIDTYQPSSYDYFMTYVGYGSCSGCDTLQAIQDYSFNDGFEVYAGDSEMKRYEEHRVKLADGIMSLALHLIQNTTMPYAHESYRDKDKFTQIS